MVTKIWCVLRGSMLSIHVHLYIKWYILEVIIIMYNIIIIL